MNERNQLGLKDDARLDRLVDGELSGDEYRRLLASFEEEPGAWRRCAMAFLEAQGWGTELRSVRSDWVTRSIPLPSEPTGATNSPATLRWASWLAIAASLLVMFGLGAIYQRGLPSDGTGDFGSAAAANKTVVNKIDTSPHGLEQRSLEQSPVTSSERIEPIQNLRFVVTDEHGETRRVDVPLYDANRVGTQLLSNDNLVVPQSILELFRQRGFHVQRYQRYMPVDLEDGRQAVVPIDGYQFVPVGFNPY